MTGALDADFGPLAVELLSEFGKAVTLNRVTAGTYDPATSKATNSEKSETVNALLEDYKPYELANGLAVVGDKKLTVAAQGFKVPALTDGVTIDGTRFAIVSLQTIYSGELAALYIIQGRKA